MGNLSSAERIVLDIDGVIFHGDKLIDGAREAICRIMSKFTNTYFLSNSSLTTSNQLCRKLNKHGIDIDVEYVLTSASAVIQFCLRKKIKNIYLIAEKAIHKEFKKNKINTDCVGKSSEAVVVLLNRDFEYKHIIDSISCLIDNPNCLFIAANQDRNYPISDDVYHPGCGALVSAVSYASKRSVDFFIGKPNPRILNVLLGINDVPQNSVAIVGDSLESDIGLAINSNQIGVYIGNSKNDRDIITYPSLYDFSSSFLN
jgi:HAD superfamily hydrolase (TIGR01450 family)